jgi:hypothetical protein
MWPEADFGRLNLNSGGGGKCFIKTAAKASPSHAFGIEQNQCRRVMIGIGNVNVRYCQLWEQQLDRNGYVTLPVITGGKGIRYE